MAHKTLIEGTTYDLAGGMTLVGGTAYEIAGGKTLVEGTAYDIPFSSTSAIPVLLSGDTYNPESGVYEPGVWIHGCEYTSDAGNIVVYEGDEIWTNANLYVNGFSVWKTFVVPGDITKIEITLFFDSQRGSEVWIYTS